MLSIILIFSMFCSIISVFATSQGETGDNGSGSGSGIDDYINTKAFVYYDHGGFMYKNAAPDQGYYQNGKWYNGSKNTSTLNFFMDKIEDRVMETINNNKARWNEPDGYIYSDSFGGNITKTELKNAMEEACQKAIARSGDPSMKARIVGVAFTYSIYNRTNYDTGTWQFSSFYSGDLTYESMFSRAPKISQDEFWTPLKNNTDAWTQVVRETTNHNKALGAQSGETWLEYLYRNKDVDNTGWSDVSNKGRIIVLAVTDDWPETNSYLALKKVSANTNITG